ncbi:hypothetical protein ACOSQ2_010451 [Xanthoceras sorbifolium]
MAALELAMLTGHLSSLSRAGPQVAVVALHIAGLVHHCRELEDASTGRVLPRIAHWLGLDIFIARRGARGGWLPCMQLLVFIFVFFFNQNGVVLDQLFGAKTAPFHLNPAALGTKRTIMAGVNFLNLRFDPSTLTFFHRCPSTKLLKLYFFLKNI